MGFFRLLGVAALAAGLCHAHRAHTSSIALQTPTVILQQVDFEASIKLPELKNGSVYPRHLWYRVEDSDGSVVTNGSVKTLDVDGNFRSQLSIPIKQLQLDSYGEHNLTTTVWEEQKLEPPTEAPEVNESNANVSVLLTSTVQLDEVEFDEVLLFRATHTTSVVVSPGWVSLLPPLVTLVMSAVLGQVTVSLLVGIWCGAIIVSNGDPFTAFLRTFDQYWVNAFTVDDHAGVLLFTIVLGGTIGVVQKGGGGHGLALVAKKFMTSSLRMQLSTWLLCLVIFFDDYSCILIVGSSLRQVLSQTGVSREKFAAIIHTVGVCLPSMSPVSAWIGVEIGYVAAQLRDLKLDWDPFVTCLSCLHYRFFPILFIAFIFITIICEKDFGPMVQFEKDAAASPINDGSMTPVFPGPMDSPKPELAPLEPDTTKPLRWQNAVVPFLTIVVLTFVGMIFDGFNSLYTQDPNGSFGILDALSHCDSVSSLIRASAAGWVLSVTLLLLQRIITLNEATKAWMEGVKDILDPTLILTLAWALGSVIGEISTAPYIASVVGDSFRSSSYQRSRVSSATSGGDAENLRQCFGSILGGSVFGNTCSPIADTSILASLSAHVPLENHVRSILPYAVLVAVVSVVGGSLPIGLKICSTFTAFGICLAVLLLVVFFCGTRVNMRYRSLSSCSFLSVSPPMRYEAIRASLLVNEHGELGGGGVDAHEQPVPGFLPQVRPRTPGELTAVFDPELSDEARSEMYAALDVSVAMKYSWAIPDERALQIIKHYGPIVEMGAVSDGGEADEEPDDEEEEIEEESDDEEEVEVEQVYWTEVLKGTPKGCFYRGRTSSEEFQTHLATVYHKVLQVPLPSWHSSIDTLTVWKRTKSSITDGAMYAFIPENERIDLVAASPSTRHLLLLGNIDAEPTTTSKSKKRRRGKNKATGKQAEDDEHSEPSEDDENSTKPASKAKRASRRRALDRTYPGPRASPCRASFMTKQRHSLTYSAEYEFGDDNILTAAYFEDTRLRNLQRIKHAHSVISTEAGGRTINNRRGSSKSKHNQILLERLDRIHKKVPKQFDVSHHTQERLSIKGPSNYPQWQREQERIAEENKKMKRRIDQTKSLFNTKQLAADAAKYLYLSEKLSKADRRMQLKQRCKQLNFSPMPSEGTTNSKIVETLTNCPESAQRLKASTLRLLIASLLHRAETEDVDGASDGRKFFTPLPLDTAEAMAPPRRVGMAGLFVGTRYILRPRSESRRGIVESTRGGGFADGFAHEARVIESADGLRATPAAVAVDNGSVSVGAIAKSLQGRKPGYTATATRLLLGPATREREELIKKLPYTVHQRGETLELELDGKSYSPEWATEIMLDHLHTSAAASLGEDPIENFPAVLAVPAGTDEHERAAYEKVANSAGFTVFAELTSCGCSACCGETIWPVMHSRGCGVCEDRVIQSREHRHQPAVYHSRPEGRKHLVHKVTSFDLGGFKKASDGSDRALQPGTEQTGVSKEDLSALVLVGGVQSPNSCENSSKRSSRDRHSARRAFVPKKPWS
ncbi:hypothetical protein GQ600_14083 [Phytophthora cactorum]|nr:hypothetical protein GQ600_14083 [Phytophthora cactorum]